MLRAYKDLGWHSLPSLTHPAPSTERSVFLMLMRIHSSVSPDPPRPLGQSAQCLSPPWHHHPLHLPKLSKFFNLNCLPSFFILPNTAQPAPDRDLHLTLPYVSLHLHTLFLPINKTTHSLRGTLLPYGAELSDDSHTLFLYSAILNKYLT